MKFLIFNIVVAAALVFLFAGDKGDLTAIAGKTERMVSDIKTRAANAVAPQTPAAPTATKSVAAPVEKPAVKTKEAAPPIPQPAARAVATPAAATPLPKTEIPDRTPEPPLPPEFEKRRAEVFDDGTGVVADGSAGTFMPADTRKRELMLLSEEMELFSAKAIGR